MGRTVNGPHRKKTCLWALLSGKALTSLLMTDIETNKKFEIFSNQGLLLVPRKQIIKTLIRQHRCAGWSGSLLLA